MTTFSHLVQGTKHSSTVLGEHLKSRNTNKKSTKMQICPTKYHKRTHLWYVRKEIRRQSITFSQKCAHWTMQRFCKCAYTCPQATTKHHKYWLGVRDKFLWKVNLIKSVSLNTEIGCIFHFYFFCAFLCHPHLNDVFE